MAHRKGGVGLRLTLENGTVYENPDATEIESALRSLSWATDNSFAILEQTDQTYMQTAREDDPNVDPQNPFCVLEYQDGSLDRHFHAVGAIALDRVIEAFVQYVRGDDTWRNAFEWERIDLGK
jgi:hypothetical protein